MKLIKISIFSLFCFVVEFSTMAVTNLPYSQQMAKSQMSRSSVITSWDYPNGLFVESILEVYNVYGGNEYYTYALNHAKATVNATTGKIATGYSFTAYTLDNINPGQFLMQIYDTEKSSQYKIALDTLRKQITKQPRTNNNVAGGFWHKNSYPHQMWLDGLYMGTRFYAAYDKKYNNGAGYDDIVNQFVLIHSKTYDPVYQLNYHAWSAKSTDANSFWANKNAPFQGCSKEFWGRGMGWYAAALVDVLEILPADYGRRQELVVILNQVAAGIKRWQDPASGCWYQLLRYDNTMKANNTPNYIEASASGMFTYALLKAIRLGFIVKSDYLPTATKAYQGLITNFISTDTSGNISLNRICRSAGLGPSGSPTRDGTINYYLNGSDAGQIVSNDLKGVGPFILASVEYEILNNPTALKSISDSYEKDIRITNHKNKLSIKSTKSNLSEVTIYNLMGIEMKHWSGKEFSEVDIDMSGILNSIYFLQINGGECKKLILGV